MAAPEITKSMTKTGATRGVHVSSCGWIACSLKKAHIISVTRRPVGDRGPVAPKERPAPRSAPPARPSEPMPSEPPLGDDEEPF